MKDTTNNWNKISKDPYIKTMKVDGGTLYAYYKNHCYYEVFFVYDNITKQSYKVPFYDPFISDPNPIPPFPGIGDNDEGKWIIKNDDVTNGGENGYI